MQDELTTEMHWEFMADEITREDFLVMAVVGVIILMLLGILIRL